MKFRLFLLLMLFCVRFLNAQAALPQRTVETRISFTPSSDYPTYVGPATPAPSLPQVLLSARPGAMIVVDPASTTNLTSTLKGPNGDCVAKKWITVRTSSSLIPDEYTRITPAFEAQLPKLVIQAQSATFIPGKCSRWIGFEITRKDGGIVYNMVTLQDADNTILDRMYIHGNAADETVRGVALSNSTNAAVINSYISDMHCLSPGNCTDSQAIAGGISPTPDGPFKIDNNYLEASGENILFGGGAAYGPPCDIEITNNTLTKPMSWNPMDPSYGGKKWLVKNLFELKNGCRVRFENNTLSNTWGGFSQVGAMILVTPKNQGGANGTNVCPLCAVIDITIRNNHASYGAQALQLACIASPNGGLPAACHNWDVTNNVFDHLQYPTCFQCASFLNQLASGSATVPLSKVNVTGNKFLLDQPGVYLKPPAPGASAASAALILGSPLNGILGIHWDNNIMPSGNNGIYSTGGGPTNNCFSTGYSIKPLIAKCWPDGSLTGNTINQPADFDKRRLPWTDGNTIVQ